MRKSYLVKPNVQTRSFKVTDFADVTDYCEGFYLGEKLTPSNFTANFMMSCGVLVKAIYVINGKRYVKDDVGFLYEQNGKTFTEKFKCGESKGTMETIVLQGENRTLYLDDKVAKILEDLEYEIELPCGNSFAIHKQRCFSAKEYTVYFGSEFDVKSKSIMLDNCGNINFNYEQGKVIGLFDFSSYLLIVCKNSFHKLTIIDGEFKLETLTIPYLNIDTQSLAKINDKLLFVSDKNLCVYEDFTIKKLPSIFIKDLINEGNIATCNEDYYFCQSSNVNKRCVLIYDPYNNKETLVYTGQNELMYKNMLYNFEEQAIYFITQNLNGACKWISKAMHLGDMNKKSLVEVCVKVNNSSTLTISGDFGSKTFDLKAGINKKTMNLYSKEYVFEIKCNTKDLIASDLQLKYIV